MSENDKTPINADERELQKHEDARVLPELETDSWSEDEQKKIVSLIMDYAESAEAAYIGWKLQREKDIQHVEGEAPSVIQGLSKFSWQSDVNLGLCAGICDIYQAILLATCYNPELINFKATEENDINNRDNLSVFTKWGLSKNEADFFPEVDEFIQNRIQQGFSIFKVYWEVKEEWVTKLIPKYSDAGGGRRRVVYYDKEPEKRRFERGVIKNVSHLDDILIPDYGTRIQDLKFIIEKLHFTLADLEDFENRGIIVSYNEGIAKKLQGAAQEIKANLKTAQSNITGVSKITPAVFETITESTPVEIYEAYIKYTKDGKRERYRFWIEPSTWTFLSGKPLRMISRSGKLPYAGGPLRKKAGMLMGGSLPQLIEGCITALNNNYNQTSDFQYIENMPFGFMRRMEGMTQNMFEITPGMIRLVDDDPSKMVHFPNLTRSLAWSYQDKNFLLEMIERMTGAASYFLTSQSKDATATRDAIVNKMGDTKFGLWVRRIQEDISDAINQWKDLYQEFAPPKLAGRIVGEDGKRLFHSLDIDSLRWNGDAYITPDVTAGSRIFEREIKMWAFQNLQGSVWFDPRVNPRGNWMLTKDAMDSMGWMGAEKYLPPQPKEPPGTSKEVSNEFTKFMNGEKFDPPEGVTPMVVEHLMGHVQQAQERIHELTEETRPGFEDHLFKTYMNYRRFLAQVEQEKMAMEIASSAVNKLGALTKQVPAQPTQPVNPNPAMNPRMAESIGARGV